MKKIVSPMLPFFMIVCLQSMAANFAHPVTPTIIQNLGLGDYMFGLAFAGMAGTSFLFSPFWGKLADYVQSRTILLICNLGYAVGQILFSLGTTEVTIMMARFVSGFFVGGVNVCMLTYTVNMSAPEQRGSHLTIQATAVTVAGTFGYSPYYFKYSHTTSLNFSITYFTSSSDNFVCNGNVIRLW